MAEKYPNAHLTQKQFIEKPQGEIGQYLSKMLTRWGSTPSHDNIYFKKDNLKEINYLYKKTIDGYLLTDEEQLAMARQEFMLLHEAGHIENKDTANLIATILNLLIVLNGAHLILDGMKSFDPRDTLRTNDLYICATYLTFFVRNQTSQADAFAYKNIDTQTLVKALSLFENNETDPLFDAENQFLVDHIKTDSTCGKIIQTIVNPFEYVYFYTGKNLQLLVKSTFATRWIYDFYRDFTQPGPSVRAQAIKDELERRQAQA